MLEDAERCLGGGSVSVRGGGGRRAAGGLTSMVPPLAPGVLVWWLSASVHMRGEEENGRRTHLNSCTAKTKSATGQSSFSRTKRTTAYADKSAGADSTPHCGIICGEGGGQRSCAGGQGGGARTIAPVARAASWYSSTMSITHGISPVEST